MTTNDVEELMRGRMDHSDFVRVLGWLRKADPDDRLLFIRSWLHLPGLIIRLATSAINHRGESLAIVQTAFDAITQANSTLTRAWCQFAVTKLGLRRTVRLLRERFDTLPHVVDMACYWLPSMISSKDPAYADLQALCRDAATAGIIRPAKQTEGPTGQTLFHDRYSGTYPTT